LSFHVLFGIFKKINLIDENNEVEFFLDKIDKAKPFVYNYACLLNSRSGTKMTKEQKLRWKKIMEDLTFAAIIPKELNHIIDSHRRYRKGTINKFTGVFKKKEDKQNGKRCKEYIDFMLSWDMWQRLMNNGNILAYEMAMLYLCEGVDLFACDEKENYYALSSAMKSVKQSFKKHLDENSLYSFDQSTIEDDIRITELCILIGDMYYASSCIKDMQEALRWYSRALERDKAKKVKEYGRVTYLYSNAWHLGLGGFQSNESERINWLHLSADRGYGLACYELYMIDKYIGDDEKADKWKKLAEENGISDEKTYDKARKLVISKSSDWSMFIQNIAGALKGIVSMYGSYLLLREMSEK
jgi:TPR repeat protein